MKNVTGFVAFLLECGEGQADYLYLDQASPPNVTTGIGCMLASLADALALEWRQPSGMPVSRDLIAASWKIVTSRPELAAQGGGAYAHLTMIRLTSAAILALVEKRIGAFEAELLPFFPKYADAPDKAQEGLLRLAWATGAARFAARWPKFTAAWNASAWADCAKEDVIPNLDHTGEPKANALEGALFTACVTTPAGAPT